MNTRRASAERAQAVLDVPPSDRYARFALPPRDRLARVVLYKHLLEDLLGERCPEYDTRKRKEHGQLPTQRYFAEGPLSDIFDRYVMPDFVPSTRRESVRAGTGEITWYAFNYAVWRDRVLTNGDLDVFESTTTIERTVSADRHVGTGPRSAAGSTAQERSFGADGSVTSE